MIVVEEEKVRKMLEGLFKFGKECEWNDAIEEAMNRFLNLPTFDTDISEYSDRLWKLAYERGQKEGVIRCKDCEYYSLKNGQHTCYLGNGIGSDDAFCSYAERRTDVPRYLHP